MRFVGGDRVELSHSRIVGDFVEAVPSMRVFPSDKELSSFWRRCAALDKALRAVLKLV